MEQAEILKQGTGKRKTAVAQLRVYGNGKGDFKINGKTVEDYFIGSTIFLSKLQEFLDRAPIDKNNYDFKVKVEGSGYPSQLHAILFSIVKAFDLTKNKEESTEKLLKDFSVLRPNTKQKERQKPGQKKARKERQSRKR